MNIVIGILVGLLVLMFLIVSHEFGHFLAARRSGVRVKEFGIGFPPRLKAWVRVEDKKTKKKSWKKLPKSEWGKDQETLILSLNSLPIGGFCAMDGESDADERKGTFGAATYWKKTKILFAGVAMNWLVAFVILTVLAWTGLPTMLENQFTIASDETVSIESPITVDGVYADSPASAAGFEVGDEIIAVISPSGERTEVYSSSEVVAFGKSFPGETVSYVINRKTCAIECVQEPCECTNEDQFFSNSLTLTPTLNSADSSYLLGITMKSGSSVSHYTWSAPVVGAGLTVQLTGETYKGLWNMLKNLITGAARQVNLDASVREEGLEQISEATESLSGIVGILGSYFPGIVSAGPTYVFVLAAIISISLACMNVLPIPALDGGRWLMITIARLKHKKLSQETEQKIVSRAFVFLLILMAIITVMDIIRLF